MVFEECELKLRSLRAMEEASLNRRVSSGRRGRRQVQCEVEASALGVQGQVNRAAEDE